MLHPHIQVMSSEVIHGSGLIACHPIAQGEVVSRLEPGMPTLRIEDVLAASAEEQERLLHYGYQCDETHMVFENEPERLMNHACDPNTWWADDQTMIARRDIAAGEEITYDYATTEITVPFELTCNCGSLNCRHSVTHLDYQSPAWQAQYQNHLPLHVLKAIARLLQAE
jgi:SET domain-containing protein